MKSSESINLRVPFHQPTVLGCEADSVRESLAGIRSGAGIDYSRRVEELLEKELGVARVMMTPSCAAAQDMTALLMNLAPDDEVIVPSFTFVSTANAFHQHGARIIFADIRPDTLNLDHDQAARLITPRTRAIVAVHYAGIAVEMEPLLKLGVPVIEDNAHGLFGRYKGKSLGSMGRAGAVSFHSTKNFTCGEGGALFLNDPAWIDRAEVIRENGTNRKQFLRGAVDRYTWVDYGSTYRLAEPLAAILLAQLTRRNEIQSRRRGLWERYAKKLAGWASAQRFRLPHVPDYCDQSYHTFYMIAPDNGSRDRLIRHLSEHGIHAVFHYVPLHSSPRGRDCGRAPLGCPVTEDLAARLVRLPFFTALTPSDHDEVIQAVEEFEA